MRCFSLGKTNDTHEIVQNARLMNVQIKVPGTSKSNFNSKVHTSARRSNDVPMGLLWTFDIVRPMSLQIKRNRNLARIDFKRP